MLFFNNLLPDYLKTSSLVVHACIYGILFLIIMFFIKREWHTTSNITRNKYIINPAEILPNVSYYSYPVKEIQHIFWSGGINSTALLCYNFIVMGLPIQPIYISGIPGSNNSQDLLTLQKIRKELLARYPHLQSRLLPTWIITSVDINRRITSTVKDILKQLPGIEMNKLLVLDLMTRFTKSYNKSINLLAGYNNASPILSITPELFNTIFARLLDNKLIMPLAGLTQDDIKQIALDSKNYYWDIIANLG